MKGYRAVLSRGTVCYFVSGGSVILSAVDESLVCNNNAAGGYRDTFS